MTLSSTTSSETVLGDGLSTTFNYSFPMGGSEAYAVLIFTDATGATSSITSSDFSVANVSNPSGGTFTYPLAGSPISTGTSLTLYRTVPLVQNSTIQDQGNFAPIIVDGALDYQTMALQQLQREIDTLNSQVDSFLTGSISSVTTGMIANQAVTYPKFQNVAASKLLGNPTTASTTVSEIGIDSTLTFSGTTLGVAPSTASQTAGLFFITSSSPSGVASVTFSSIPSTFTNLLVEFSGRGTSTSTITNLQLTFNGDTGSNYDWNGVLVFTSVVSADGLTASTSINLTGALAGDGATAGRSGGGRFTVYNYKNTSLHKSVTFHQGTMTGTTLVSMIAESGYGTWVSTASINRLDLKCASGNWSTGSVVSLYGTY